MMNDPPPPLTWRRALMFIALVVAGLVVAMKLDPLVERALADPKSHLRDWHRALRVMGYFPLWVVLSIAIAQHDWPRTVGKALTRRLRRGLILTLSPMFAGITAELTKLIVRRERPEFSTEAGQYAFRSILDGPLSTSGLGFPSSHTAVAFGAGCALSALFPNAKIIWLLAAAGCGYTRLADEAHHFSDVYFGAVLGYACAWLTLRLLRRRNHTLHVEPQL